MYKSPYVPSQITSCHVMIPPSTSHPFPLSCYDHNSVLPFRPHPSDHVYAPNPDLVLCWPHSDRSRPLILDRAPPLLFAHWSRVLYFTWIHFFCVCTSYLACTGILVVGSVGPVETVYANSLLTDLFLVFSSCLGFSFPFLSPHTPDTHLQRNEGCCLLTARSTFKLWK